MKWSPRRKAFRGILSGERCVFPISVYDPLTSRLAGEMGFEVMMLAGSIGAMAVAGVPDWILINSSEFSALANRINEAGTLPLLVDADHGYGNAMNVQRTIAQLDTAGVAAATIEDTVLPTTYGEIGQAGLVPLDEGVGKMRAALSGRGDKDFAIIARTSALRVTGIEDAVARAKAYEACGVDAMCFIAVRTAEELDAVTGAVSIPIMFGGLAAGLADADDLARRGVRISLYGHQPFQAALQAAYDTMRAIKDGSGAADLGGLAGSDLLAAATGQDQYEQWQQDFLGAKDV